MQRAAIAQRRTWMLVTALPAFPSGSVAVAVMLCLPLVSVLEAKLGPLPTTPSF